MYIYRYIDICIYTYVQFKLSFKSFMPEFNSGYGLAARMIAVGVLNLEPY